VKQRLLGFCIKANKVCCGPDYNQALSEKYQSINVTIASTTMKNNSIPPYIVTQRIMTDVSTVLCYQPVY
jgi:hypothetical protein